MAEMLGYIKGGRVHADNIRKLIDKFDHVDPDEVENVYNQCKAELEEKSKEGTRHFIPMLALNLTREALSKKYPV